MTRLAILCVLLLGGCTTTEVVYEKPDVGGFAKWVSKEMPRRTKELGLDPIRVEIVSRVPPKEHEGLVGWFEHHLLKKPMITLWLYTKTSGGWARNSITLLKEITLHEILHYWDWKRGDGIPAGPHDMSFRERLLKRGWLPL